MKLISLKKIAIVAILSLAFCLSDSQTKIIFGQTTDANTEKSFKIKELNVRAQMEFLASDALQGRGSGTQFEWIAGQYIASQLMQFGVEPAGEKDSSGATTYLQTVKITRNSFTENPKLTYSANGSTVNLEHGKEMVILRIAADQISGGLQKMTLDDTPKAGAIAFIKLRESDNLQTINQKIQSFATSGAAAIIIEETPQYRAQWNNFASRKLGFITISNSKTTPVNTIVISKDAATALAQMADGTNIEIKGKLGDPQVQQTWNTVGKIVGSDPKLSSEVILLSAHQDHLGVRPNALTEDKIYNGADDDASGCIAVLELARVLASGKRPKRSVYFSFFGSEEAGGFGANYFVNNLPFPKDKLVANLEFEMIGRPDEKVKPEELWLTGYERSNLGAELAKRGAKLVQDPHPEQNFFQRSDNITLARQGIIAHTVSSYGLHKDYHQASDEIKTIDFKHITYAINSMVEPIEWLINSDFKPAWYEGKKP